MRSHQFCFFSSNGKQLILSLSLIGLQACNGSSSSGVSGDSISASTTIKSSNISTSTSNALVRSPSSKSKTLASVSGLNDASNPCPTGDTTCFTPVAMGGKFSGFNLKISTRGTYYRFELVPPPTTEGEAEVTSEDLNDFDLGSPTAISSSISCCDGITFDDTSYISNFNWTLGWIDAVFENADLGFGSGTSALRFVFFDDSVTGYQKGDILLRDGGVYKWCEVGATSVSNCSTTRPATPITQDSAIVNYTAEAGSPDLPYLEAGIFPDATGEGRITTSASELQNALSFVVDFDQTDAFAVAGASTTFANIFQAMPELYLRGFSAVPTGVSVAGGINAVLTLSE